MLCAERGVCEGREGVCEDTFIAPSSGAGRALGTAPNPLLRRARRRRPCGPCGAFLFYRSSGRLFCSPHSKHRTWSYMTIPPQAPQDAYLTALANRHTPHTPSAHTAHTSAHTAQPAPGCYYRILVRRGSYRVTSGVLQSLYRIWERRLLGVLPPGGSPPITLLPLHPAPSP